MFDDPLPESLALLRIGMGGLERRAGAADGLRRHTDPAGGEVGERDAEPAAFRAQQVGVRHRHVLEYDLRHVVGAVAELALLRDRPVAGIAGRRDESGDAALAGRRIGDRDDHRQFRRRAAGNESLVAVEAPAAVDFLRPGADRRRVGTGVRLGQMEAADPFARGELGSGIRSSGGPCRAPGLAAATGELFAAIMLESPVRRPPKSPPAPGRRTRNRRRRRHTPDRSSRPSGRFRPSRAAPTAARLPPGPIPPRRAQSRAPAKARAVSRICLCVSLSCNRLSRRATSRG